MNKQKSTEQTKKQQKTWIKIIKIIGIVLICLILFALIAFGVLRALGKSGIRKNISGEAPVLESTESTEEGWQDGWIRYNGQIYAYNEDIMTFLVMGVDNDDVVKKAKDGLSGGQADAMFLAVMNPHDKSVSIIASTAMRWRLWMSMMRMAFTWDSIPSRSLCSMVMVTAWN